VSKSAEKWERSVREILLFVGKGEDRDDTHKSAVFDIGVDVLDI